MGIPGLTVRLISRGHWITMEQQTRPQGEELDHLDRSQPGTTSERQQSQQQIQQQSQRQSQEQSQGRAAILDGPGLAYYIGRQYREDNLANTSTELNPAYSEIGARAVQFLEDLEAVGLQV